MKMNMDKAGKQYWDATWQDGVLPAPVDPRKPGLSRHRDRSFHGYFQNVFQGVETRGLRFLEIGCAQSVWLPYFAREYGFEVSGLDYSEIGCEQEKQILAAEGIDGDVVCADFFSPPEEMLGAFDVVVSFGVAEHFEDTAACLEAFSKFLRPGGMLITSIPNLTGLIGSIQKKVNRPVFDIHVLLNAQTLAAAHRRAGLQVIRCNYFMNTNFGVLNLNGLPTGSALWLAKKILLALLVRYSMAVWFLEEKTRPFRATRLIAPAIICVARKPDA